MHGCFITSDVRKTLTSKAKAFAFRAKARAFIFANISYKDNNILKPQEWTQVTVWNKILPDLLNMIPWPKSRLNLIE